MIRRRWVPAEPKRADLPSVPLTPEGIEGRIHLPQQCGDELCIFHGPSDHLMVGWPIHVRADRSFGLCERICEHGTGHPDPDSLAFVEHMFVEMGLGNVAKYEGYHGCDGCCTEQYPDE